MLLQVVIKNGLVLATHPIDQDLTGKYPGTEIIFYNGDIGPEKDGIPTPDPRIRGDRNIVARRPPTRMLLADDDGARHAITVERTGTLRTAKI